MNQNNKVYLQDLGIICALGANKEEVSHGVFNAVSNSLTFSDEFSPGRELPIGKVKFELPDLSQLPDHEQTRCNQLMLAALNQIRPTLDNQLAKIESLKVGVVVGTSTSGIGEGELAMKEWFKTNKWPDKFSYKQQEMSNAAQALARWIGASGPVLSISTACSSSAKALACARRLLRSGVCDVVVAGGADSLCELTINGFSALDSVSSDICNPFSLNRKGINIGEGAALFVVTKEFGPVCLSGVGESSDAHHISAPAPDGAGAISAMTTAIKDANITAGDINYLNLHGTATPQNDKMESLAVSTVLGAGVPCSSTKGYTGHTLGAAGGVEAGVCWLSLIQDQNSSAKLPVQLWDGVKDPDNKVINLVSEPTSIDSLNFAMSNSFAFGGNNISLVLERTT